MAQHTTRRVVITGMGVISPLGSTVDLFWHLLSRGQSAVKPLRSFDTTPFQACLAAEVEDFDPEDYLHRKQARRMGRATQFAVASAIDADTSQEARDEMAAEGHDVLTLPFSDALQRFNREWDEHLKTCEKASEQP